MAVAISAPVVSSVSGLVGLLEDSDVGVQSRALMGLLAVVDNHWHEIAEGLPTIETLAADLSFPQHKAASLLAAIVLYNLEVLDAAVNHALAAEDLFDISQVSEFARSIIAAAVHSYCLERARHLETAGDDESAIRAACFESTCSGPLERKLEILVERMMVESRAQGLSGQIEALGVALESCRLDQVHDIIMNSQDPSYLLKYCVERAETILKSHRYRQYLLNLLVDIYEAKFPTSQKSSLRSEGMTIIKLLFMTDKADSVATILHHLLVHEEGSSDDDQLADVLLAYQMAFDLVSFENQQFLVALLEHPLLRPPVSTSTDEGALTNELPSPTSPRKDTDRPPDEQPLLEDPQPAPEMTPLEPTQGEPSKEFTNLTRLHKILSGEASLTLCVEFLHRHNHTDLALLDQIKSSVDNRSSITQNAIVMSHALMQAGTTCDSFLRENLDWLARAVCWAKFVAAASAGVLHRGHIQASRQVLSSYLPGSGGGPYSEGGALYGLGFIHVNVHDRSTRDYIVGELEASVHRTPQNFEPLQHGACLGLGLVSMGTDDAVAYAALRDVLFADSAVAGEAAALGMGLISMGTGSENTIAELLAYARDTEHEKIIRAAALGVALVLFQKEEEADFVVDQMARDKDPMIRYAAMFGLGLAYCGTSNSTAARRLLHVAVSDLSGDVRRAAVISLGFVLCNEPSRIPKAVSLLADSFNPYVRYGAALAVGVGCAGTAAPAAVDLLLPMTQDTTDFVRQGALLGLGLVLVQASTNSSSEGRVQQVRDLFVRIAADRHEDATTRFGAIVAQGLIDAGGRNCTISFFSSIGALRPEAAVGFLLFSQLWYWFPLVLGISLAFRPTALIGLDEELTTPSDFQVYCEAPHPERFAYVDTVPRMKKEERRETTVAVLSTTSRRKQREQMKRPGTGEVANLPTPAEEEMTVKPPPEEKEDKPEAMVPINTPCRVLPGQEQFMNLLAVPTSAWIPVDPGRKAGIIMVRRKANQIS